MTDTATPIPRSKHSRFKRRLLIYLAGAVIVAAGTVVGTLKVTHRALGHPRPSSVVSPTTKARPTKAPAAAGLSTASFEARWASLVEGPSTVSTGSIVLSWNGSGATATPGPTAPVVVTIDSASHWVWTIPKITFPGGSHHAEAGTATPAGSTVVEPDAYGGVYHYGANDWAVLGGIPIPRYSELQRGEPILTLGSPHVLGSNSTSWSVRFSVLVPTCYDHVAHASGACAGSTLGHVWTVQAPPQTLPSTVTLTVTPTTNGLKIALPHASSTDRLPTGVLNVEPVTGSSASSSSSSSSSTPTTGSSATSTGGAS
jgi:hypothetical protein